MAAVGTASVVRTAPGFVVGVRTVLLRGSPGEPFGHLAPVAPVWRILVGGKAPVTWRGAGRPRQAAGVVVPPEVAIDVAVTDRIVVLHLDAAGFALSPNPVFGRREPFPILTVDRGWADLGHVATPEAVDHRCASIVETLRAERVLSPARAQDPRVAAGIALARDLGSVAEAAAAVGLSRARFHRLVRERTGSTPTRLRTWERLRHALAVIDDLDLAEVAATAGFADQAHLTRTCTRFLGATPGRLRASAVCVPRDPRACEHAHRQVGNRSRKARRAASV